MVRCPRGSTSDLVRAAGFTDVRAVRSLSGGNIEGVEVYSVSVSAHKGHAASQTPGSVIPLAAASACGCA